MITSKDNEIIKHISKLLSSARYRRETGTFAAEGVRLCTDGAESGATDKAFLYTARAAEKYSENFEKIRQAAEAEYELSDALFKKISDTTAPQGFMCIFKTLDKMKILNKIDKKGKYAALENIQDPSNMGTILRTAEALGTSGIILSSDCCDIYSPKVVRGSMGAVFRIPVIIVENFTEYISGLTESGMMTYASTPHQAENINSVNFSGGSVVLIGNEGNGLKEETINACYKRIKIPMNGRAESLNAAAAAAILLYCQNNKANN